MAAAAGAAAAGAAAVAAPDPLEGVRNVLRVCGFNDVIRPRFIDAHRITAFGDFEFMPCDEAKDIFKMYNLNQRQQNHRLGYLEQAKFTAFLWWYHDLKRRKEVPRAADFTPAALTAASEDMKSEAQLVKADKVNTKVPKLDVDMGWFDWCKGMSTYLATKIGMQRFGCHYVIRRNKPAGWTIADAVNEEERRVYGMSLQGR